MQQRGKAQNMTVSAIPSLLYYEEVNYVRTV